MPRTAETLLAKYPADVQALAAAARAALAKWLPRSEQVVDNTAQLRSPSDLRNPAVRALVKATYAAWKQRTAEAGKRV
jgi:hypothetical protein